LTQRIGVLGWPVAHSRSPAIHEAAFAEAGLDGWRYQLLPVPPELFDETVRALPGSGFVGANVTIPHKHAALAVADTATEAARAIGAVNWLGFDETGGIAADNTDAPGILAALGDSWPRRAVILGAGGSARATAWALTSAGAEVEVWNRTADRAVRLASDLGVRAVDAFEPGGLLVNCTSVGLRPVDDPFAALPIVEGELGEWEVVADLPYGDEPTALVTAAERAGIRVVDGLEILLEQAVFSFERWTGASAPRAAMWAAAGRPAH